MEWLKWIASLFAGRTQREVQDWFLVVDERVERIAKPIRDKLDACIEECRGCHRERDALRSELETIKERVRAIEHGNGNG